MKPTLQSQFLFCKIKQSVHCQFLRTKTYYVLFLLSVFGGSSSIFGQNFFQPVSGFADHILGPGIYNYYDNGGANGNYAANITESYISFIPQEGHFIQWHIVNYVIEDNSSLCGGECCDQLTLNYLPACGDISIYQNYCGQGSSGVNLMCGGESLHFEFRSDGTVQLAGWHIVIEVQPRAYGNILCHPESNCYNGNVGGYLECGGNYPQEISCWFFSQCGGVIDYYPYCNNDYYPGREMIYGFEIFSAQDVRFSCECFSDVFLVDIEGCESTGCQQAELINGEYVLENVPAGFHYLIAEIDCSNSGDLCYCDIQIECSDPGGGDLDCEEGEPVDCGDVISSANTINGGSDQVNDYCGSGNNYWTGNEKIYLFNPAFNGQVTISLSDLDEDLDLFLLEQCNPEACIESSENENSLSESITFEALDDVQYYIIVDGYLQAESNYTLAIECEGDLDCDNDGPIDCGDVINSSNSPLDGAINSEFDYCNQNQNHWTGNERIYFFTPEDDGEVTIELSNLENDLDLFLLDMCDGTSCLASSTNSSSTDELITYQFSGGEFYYIVIDGYDGAISFYELSVSCEDPCETTINQCADIQFSFLEQNNGLLYELSYQLPGIQILKWEINGVQHPVQNSNTVTHRFPSGGQYNVCCFYLDPLSGCIIRCCKLIDVGNPFNNPACLNISYRYFPGEGGFRFTIEDNQLQEVAWTVDEPVFEELGLGNTSRLLPIPGGQCREYIISVRYYDASSQCYRLCCLRLFLCSPSECSDVIKSTQTSDFKTRFYTDEVFPEMQWYVNDTLVSTAPSYTRLWPTNSEVQVCLYYLDPATGCYRVCCREVVTSTLEDLSIDEIDIFPNPVSEQLNIHIQFLYPTHVGVELLDELGVVVRRIAPGESSSAKFNKRLDLEGLSAGLYFLRVQTERGTYTQKIIHL